jgi:hypothetical protein
MSEVIELGKPPYTQLCVWPGTVLKEEEIPALGKYFLDEMNTRVKYHTTILTNPDLDKGVPVPETGGRSDLFFYVHSDDIPHFALSRLRMGIRWWEDVISYNKGNTHLYPKEFIEQHPPTW